MFHVKTFEISFSKRKKTNCEKSNPSSTYKAGNSIMDVLKNNKNLNAIYPFPMQVSFWEGMIEI